MIPMRFLLVLLALCCAACSKSTVYSGKDGSVTVEQKGTDGSIVKFTDKNGQSVTVNSAGGQVPADYPKDVPVYPGAKVVTTQSASQKHMINLIMETQDEVAAIADFYKKGLESNGWKIDNTMTSDQMSAFNAIKDNRQAVLQILNNDGKRTINQVVADKQ
jgi:hypothetical protein